MRSMLGIVFAMIIGFTGCSPQAQPTLRPKASAVSNGMPSAQAEPTPTSDQTPAVQAGRSATKARPNRVILGSPELTAGIPGEGDLTMEQVQAWLDDQANHEVLEIELPLGLAAGASQVKGLDANPLTRAKIELGRQLFFDPRLSSDMSVSCASCHDPDEAYTRHTQFGIGIKGLHGNRNSPVAYNRILSEAQFWDGRAATLEEQAKGPIANPIEMTENEKADEAHEACVLCLKGVPEYVMQFDRIFGELTIDTVAAAIASFERAIVTGPSPFDFNEQLRPFADLDEEDIRENPAAWARYQEAKRGSQEHPMSESAKRGREIFFSDKGGCTACHVGPNLTDEKYHNLGVGIDAMNPDLGRFVVTNVEKDKGAFKTPTIRNVAQSAPYMHDGSQKTLEEVVEWYAKGGHPNPWLSENIKKLDLSDQDKQDLVEFMKACSGDLPKVERGRLPPMADDRETAPTSESSSVH